MRVRDFAWGIPVWGAAPVVMAFAVSGPLDQWDMSIGASVGVLVGFAAAFAGVGAIIWIPAAVWLERVTRSTPWVVRALWFMVMGLDVARALRDRDRRPEERSS
ncbi:hypothetical protein [Microbacterium sp. SS28]|uniref:hypothetical protein n=1 Tax=Microbacterium sp. SS28 TaxID=2919948 RepID=UPI001FAADD64|nr:hypothetical protein [Microbacterium sp. SS28]